VPRPSAISPRRRGSYACVVDEQVQRLDDTAAGFIDRSALCAASTHTAHGRHPPARLVSLVGHSIRPDGFFNHPFPRQGSKSRSMRRNRPARYRLLIVCRADTTNRTRRPVFERQTFNTIEFGDDDPSISRQLSVGRGRASARRCRPLARRASAEPAPRYGEADRSQSGGCPIAPFPSTSTASSMRTSRSLSTARSFRGSRAAPSQSRPKHVADGLRARATSAGRSDP
jgi:hypothetical protein